MRHRRAFGAEEIVMFYILIWMVITWYIKKTLSCALEMDALNCVHIIPK